MSVLLASSQQQSAEGAAPTTVSYEGHQIYNVGPEPTDGSRMLYRNFDTPFAATVREICELRWWPEGWNGYDAAKPNPDSIEHAYSWITQLYRDLSAELWIKPHVIADADGDVVFEWWKGQKKLTIYVSPQTVEYVTVEGPDIASDMDDGVIETSRDSRMLWLWLTS